MLQRCSVTIDLLRKSLFPYLLLYLSLSRTPSLCFSSLSFFPLRIFTRLFVSSSLSFQLSAIVRSLQTFTKSLTFFCPFLQNFIFFLPLTGFISNSLHFYKFLLLSTLQPYFIISHLLPFYPLSFLNTFYTIFQLLLAITSIEHRFPTSFYLKFYLLQSIV